jgi:hypothetical protein
MGSVKSLRQIITADIERVLTEGIVVWPESRCNIVRLYHRGKTLTEAGACADVSRVRAAQVIAKFLRVCKHPSNWKKLSEQSKRALQ